LSPCLTSNSLSLERPECGASPARLFTLSREAETEGAVTRRPKTSLSLLRKKLEDQEDYEAARAEREAKCKENIEKNKEESLRKEEEDWQAREDEAREYERRDQEVLEQYRCFSQEIKRQLQAEARVKSFNAEGKAFTAALIAVTEKIITTNH
jgi:Ni/Co efflux regulator RcnB